MGGNGPRASAVVHGQRCVGQAVCAGMHSAEPCRSPFTPIPLYFTVVYFNLLMPCRTCMGRLDVLTHMTLAPLGVSNSVLEHVFANSYQCEFNLSSILFKFLYPKGCLCESIILDVPLDGVHGCIYPKGCLALFYVFTFP